MSDTRERKASPPAPKRPWRTPHIERLPVSGSAAGSGSYGEGSKVPSTFEGTTQIARAAGVFGGAS